MSEFYVPGAGATIRWNDPIFDIEWPFEPKVMSEKDKSQSDFDPGK
jgi:dTDP-4-dehydrorhamnose 3,5-epimerase